MQITHGIPGPLYQGKPLKERLIKGVAGTDEENDLFTRVKLQPLQPDILLFENNLMMEMENK
jgi:hypothetical protein